MTKLSEKNKLLVSNVKIYKYLTLSIALLVSIHIFLQFLLRILNIDVYEPIVRIFDVDNELSIPTWFSQLLLFTPALLSFLIYRLNSQQKIQGNHYWILLSLLLLYLSIDEGAMLHEAMIDYFRISTNSTNATGFLYYLWLIPFFIVVLLLLIPFLRFASNLPKQTVAILAIGLTTYVFGAIIYETLGLIFISKQEGFAYYGINVALEEFFEMMGASTIIYALLEHIRKSDSVVGFKLNK